MKIKVYGSCIRLVQKTVSFTNGIGYIPLSEIFESFNPTYAIGVSQPIDLESEGIALVSVHWYKMGIIYCNRKLVNIYFINHP